jgi:hypothetical protein
MAISIINQSSIPVLPVLSEAEGSEIEGILNHLYASFSGRGFIKGAFF